MITRLAPIQFWNLLEWREGNMALYYFVLRQWAVFGSSEFDLRLLSVVTGVLTIAAIYLLAAELYDRATGLFAALLLAVHTYHVRFSQEARSYSMLALVLVLAAYVFVRAVRTGSERQWTGFVLLAASSLYLHFFAGLVVLGFGVWLFLASARPVKMRTIISAGALLALLSFPVPWYIITHRNQSMIDWIPAPNWSLIDRCGMALFGGDGLWWIVVAVGGVAPLLFRGDRMVRAHRAAHRLLLLPAAWAFLPVAALLVASLFKPVLVERYLLMSVPGVVLFIAASVTRLQRRWCIPLAAILTFVSIGSLPASHARYAAEAEDWRAAVAYVGQHSEPGDVVLLDNGIIRPVFEYYRQRALDRVPPVYSFIPRASNDLIYYDFSGLTRPAVIDEVAKTRRRVWLFEWGNGNALVPAMNGRYRLANKQQFLHVIVRLYVRQDAETAAIQASR